MERQAPFIPQPLRSRISAYMRFAHNYIFCDMHAYFLRFIHIMHVLYEHNILNNPKIIASWFL